jgi:hypothetical protein
MARLVMMVRPPHHVRLEEAEDWLRGELGPVAEAQGVRCAAISRLRVASHRQALEWGWLVELGFEDPDTARQVAGDGPWMELMGDLRLLGMRPTVALIEGSDDLRL